VQADKELREKRKQEALAAKRYPMDDLELLSEELTAAATAALADAASDADTANKLPAMLLPAEQTDLACLSSAEHLDEAASQHVGKVLYVADTLSQFSKQLGLKGCSMAELQATLDAVAAGAAVGGAVGDGVAAKVVREALAWLACTYQGLLKVQSVPGQLFNRTAAAAQRMMKVVTRLQCSCVACRLSCPGL
jgi:hypothetical protein